MSEPARVTVSIKDFKGLATNYDAKDIPPGAAVVQLNVNGYQRGQLVVRRGLREVTFESEN